VTPASERSRGGAGWWLFYLLAAVVGIYGGVWLFGWMTG
jgi:hypothetical protein